MERHEKLTRPVSNKQYSVVKTLWVADIFGGMRNTSLVKLKSETSAMYLSNQNVSFLLQYEIMSVHSLKH